MQVEKIRGKRFLRRSEIRKSIKGWSWIGLWLLSCSGVGELPK